MFAGLAIDEAGAPAPNIANQRKALALLGLLARAGDQGLSRDKITSFLWPESDADQARNALSQLLFRARKELGSDAIVGNGELRLNPAIVSSDVSEFEAAIARGDLEAAYLMYVGPFLDGFHLSRAPEFERWVASEGAALQQSFIATIARLASRAAAACDLSAVVLWSQRRTAAEPFSARAARDYIDALIASGDRQTALRFATSYSALVRAELDVEPDADVLEAIDRARRDTPPSGSSPPLKPSPRGKEDAPPAPSGAAPSAPAASGATPVHARRSRKSRRLIAVLASLFVVAVAASLLAPVVGLTRHRSKTRPVVLVFPFDNVQRDSALDGIGRVASAWMTDAIARTGLVATVDGQAVVSTRSDRDVASSGVTTTVRP